MKKILLSTVALLSLSAGAMAADLPSRRMAPAPFVAAVPVFTWTGFYFGVNAGYGWSDNGFDDQFALDRGAVFVGSAPGIVTFDDFHADADGFLGGAQVGFNWQFGAGSGLVVGVEADIQAIDLNHDGLNGNNFVFTQTGAGTPVGPGNFVAVRQGVSSLDWFGTLRARVGFAIDRVLVYATGGFAFGDGDHDNGCPAGFFSTFCNNGGDDVRWGWTVGGGIEFALPMTAGLFGSSAVTFKVEGLYVNLDENNHDNGNLVGFNRFTGAPVFGVRTNVHDDEADFGLIRAGVNFKF